MLKHNTIFLKIFKLILIVGLVIVVHQITLEALTIPSNDRNWILDQKVLAQIELGASSVSITDIKNFIYPTDNIKDRLPEYITETFDYDKVKNVWYFQNDFTYPLGAHTFLTFEFEDDKYLSVSVEIRKEIGETYNPFSGLFNHYELHYMIVNEKDILTLRAGLETEPIYMYKIKLNKDEKKELLRHVLTRADAVNKNPEFYNTYNNSCTTNIVDHLNTVLHESRKPGTGWQVKFPKYSDQFLFSKNLIDTGLTFEEIRQSSKINFKVREALRNNLKSVDFSKFIRNNYVDNTQV